METDDPRVETTARDERSKGKDHIPPVRKLKGKSQTSVKKASDLKKALATCSSIVSELMKHEVAGPFCCPVDPEKDEVGERKRGKCEHCICIKVTSRWKEGGSR
eukprot:691593-Hanusia_phi.AAC.2